MYDEIIIITIIIINEKIFSLKTYDKLINILVVLMIYLSSREELISNVTFLKYLSIKHHSLYYGSGNNITRFYTIFVDSII